MKEEWISSSDIGQTFNGKELTLNEYMEVEKAYVHAVMEFLKENKLTSLRVIQLQIHHEILPDKSSPLYEEAFHLPIVEDAVIHEKDIPTVCKMILRNYIHCHFVSMDQFFVHFGWDYYMYIGSNQPCNNAIKFALNNKLFVEDYPSPYYLVEERVNRYIEWSVIGDEKIVGEERLQNVSLTELQKALHLSDEHPVIGSFTINPENKDFFQQFINHKIDLPKYEYYLYSGD
ncbi:DUF7683 domain-containing protein [Lysinibacillus halotolerans]|uniref:DUF7683 domain-containing protein n=1 Tax=Lysinibacillus halotolerans TaxID=1368476 RepID=A0A3M8HFS0_9BACI|nr:hypothetical protein [Lysinibacillus halotolerans]RND01199.1 hypothetical protein EC501_02815 [Lysinibacillus halotolerans]